jgi:hypothetical protein
MIAHYLPLLTATILLELAVAPLVGPMGLRKRVALDSVLFNLITHPLATLIAITPLGLTPSILLVEILVFLAEAAGYHRLTGLTVRRSVVVSLTANFVSGVASFFFAHGVLGIRW